MLRPDRPPHGWVRKQLAELAVVKLHAAIHCLRHHYGTADGDAGRTEQLMLALRELRVPLDAVHGRSRPRRTWSWSWCRATRPPWVPPAR